MECSTESHAIHSRASVSLSETSTGPGQRRSVKLEMLMASRMLRALCGMSSQPRSLDGHHLPKWINNWHWLLTHYVADCANHEISKLTTVVRQRSVCFCILASLSGFDYEHNPSKMLHPAAIVHFLGDHFLLSSFQFQHFAPSLTWTHRTN